MKHINKYIALCLLCLLGVTSCDSFLDKEYDASLLENQVFENATLTRQFLANIYTSLPDGIGLYHIDNVQFYGASRDCMTDNATSFWSEHVYRKINSDSYTANDHMLLGFWGTNFAGIRKCNQFLRNISSTVIPNTEVEGDDNKLYDRFRAEAILLRALFHFELVAYFGDAPILEDIVFDLDNPEAMNVSRSNSADVLKWVADQCDLIKDVIPFRYVSEGNWGRVNGATAYALKSRALLYRASALNNEENKTEWWADAADAANEFITKNKLSSNPFKLYPDYQKCFYETPYQNDEIIMSRSIWYTNTLETNLLPEGFSGCTGRTNPTQNFVDCFEMADGKKIDDAGSTYDPQNPYANRDPRLEATIFHHGSVWGRADYNEQRAIDVHFNSASDKGADYRGSFGGTYTGYYLKKFVNPDLIMQDKKTFAHSWIIYRYAEILLNYAEAKNESLPAPDNSVYDAVNEVRMRAGMPSLPVGLDKDQMRKRIRNERRVELSFEDHRFFDVRRWRLYDGVTSGNEAAKPYYEQLINMYGVEVTIDNGKPEFTYGTNANLEGRVFNVPKNYLFPIPYSETQKAPNLGQNPGW
ncbi:RagB/SusD family nutrient uptake outer membrane protein [Dysgonomonas sp. 511]|uniref:RagB/SusD family nutrient uptake outer membrane protein n=1 Tax=Dysgonomonas sp. 511 TaxID=2302930 RepID=UPI0013D224A5|nr:RagB/SusD family nutrient uptake outer membrane protein [Dysgonomonas sp. 511]NDV77563.1 RagB/SusD family nutrient uptake outer membrane protein [Dysgonomonas sp. 511]